MPTHTHFSNPFKHTSLRFTSSKIMAKLPSSLAFLLSLQLLFPFDTITGWKESGRGCSIKDIRIYQSPSGYTSLHVPKFTVQIVNEAWQREGVFDVKINCGGFASTNLVNPVIFRRISIGSCLVKNGNKISPGEVISFEYSNVLPYNFSVLDLKC